MLVIDDSLLNMTTPEAMSTDQARMGDGDIAPKKRFEPFISRKTHVSIQKKVAAKR